MKILKVIYPIGKQDNWSQWNDADFWGPFFIVFLYSLLVIWGQFKVLVLSVAIIMVTR